MRYMDEDVPIGVWIRLELPDMPDYIGFTYVDPHAGYSVKGSSEQNPQLAEAPETTARLPLPGIVWQVLNAETQARLNLPAQPSWLHFYGPQPEPGSLWGEWRHHAALQGMLHTEVPDDLQVMAHDGCPRIVEVRPEHVWVKVMGWEESSIGNVYRGVVLNQPHHLTTVKLNDTIRFVVPPDFPFAIMVTDKYLDERGKWQITICPHCGLSELFDAPSDLMRKAFPQVAVNPDMVMQRFSTFCPSCKSVVVVSLRENPNDPLTSHLEIEADRREPFSPQFRIGTEPPVKPRKWWQFWW